MPTILNLAPAAAGKTTYVLEAARQAAQGLVGVPRVVVATRLQAAAARQRLAAAGGALGVRVMTFDGLYTECLAAAREVYTELSEPVQYRLLRAIVDSLSLRHYASLTGRPGFIQALQRLIGELKAAQIYPEQFAARVQQMGAEPRLQELAAIYLAYQQRLQDNGWADRAGLGWLSVEALAQRAPHVGRDWPLLVVDGFDDFTPIQAALLKVLAARVGKMQITLTGTVDDDRRPLVHRRFARTRQILSDALGVQATAIPMAAHHAAPRLAYLEANLWRGQVSPPPAAPLEDHAGAGPFLAAADLTLIEAPDRTAEVRAALRWLKARLLLDSRQPGELALLMRNVTPYRAAIGQIGAEFGLPLRFVDGLPLALNPAIAALLDLLRLALPGPDQRPGLPRRLVVEAWRSPYFDWRVLAPEGIGPTDADRLDAAARQGRVISGLAQWEEALALLCARAAGAVEADSALSLRQAASFDVDETPPAPAPTAVEAALTLHALFRRFVDFLTPPAGEQPLRVFVGWLETLMGDDPQQTPDGDAGQLSRLDSLQMVAQARRASPDLAGQDVAALVCLKDVLRGLVWAEEAVASPPVDFEDFVADLSGAVEAAAYHPSPAAHGHDIIVANVIQARGLSFHAVAVLGLAEGEFPAILHEDAFLRETDRARLRQLGLPLPSTLDSAEVEFFYETMTRPTAQLLLTRPRLADNGALWQASPFWEELRRLVPAPPVGLTSESLPSPLEAASWPELIETLAAQPGLTTARAWAQQADPARWLALTTAAEVFQARSRDGQHLYDGDLTALAAACAQRFGPAFTWSASRLETYRSCPLFFFFASVLRLEPRRQPVAGPDTAQLGNMYHRIFERVYQVASDPRDHASVLAALPEAARRVLDAAPAREGFRVTAWWAQTRAEIEEDVRRSLLGLAEVSGDWQPIAFEQGFFDPQTLEVMVAGDSFRLHGVIDRIDRAPDGRLRVIDYKTGGPSSFKRQDVEAGKKLQLPLYALAARDALHLGQPADGFYWHVRQAQPSDFTLPGSTGGPAAAMRRAADFAWEAVQGIRAGRFAPTPPADGCPDYCPAAAFCWRYRPRYVG
jgi:RecB family exonuclease/superfamily I DNA/RNA helicase